MLRDGKIDRSVPASIVQCSQPKQLCMQSLDIAYPQILQEIADEHKFSVTFVDVMEPSAAGERQLIVFWFCAPVSMLGKLTGW